MYRVVIGKGLKRHTISKHRLKSAAKRAAKSARRHRTGVRVVKGK